MYRNLTLLIAINTEEMAPILTPWNTNFLFVLSHKNYCLLLWNCDLHYLFYRNISKQEALGRTDHQLSFDKTQAAWKMKRSTVLLLRIVIAAGTCLPSRCLIQNGRIHLIDPLPCNDVRDAHTDTQTGGRDLWSTPLRWVRAPWYTYQVS
jgi:hypothetical protein